VTRRDAATVTARRTRPVPRHLLTGRPCRCGRGAATEVVEVDCKGRGRRQVTKTYYRCLACAGRMVRQA
jgi:hypothetical protein